MKRKELTKEITIESLNDKVFLSSLNSNQIEQACDVLRQKILEVTSNQGGHLSSNLGLVETTVALHRVFDFPKDKLIFDVGHQSYAHKMLTGRDLSLLNKENGIIGFQSRKESEYDPYDAGHSSTALSAADAFRAARTMNGGDYEIIAVVGDASIANGLSFEALNSIGGHKDRVIVVLNDNDMSITKSVGGIGQLFRQISSAHGYLSLKRGFRAFLSKGKIRRKILETLTKFKNWMKRKLISFNIFENLGFVYIGPVDGHNEKQIEKALIKAKKTNKPVVVHVRTQKGKGYGPAEKDKDGYWHGVTPFDIESSKPKNIHPGFISWSNFYASLTKEVMEKNEKAVVITAATLKGANLEDVFAAYPNRSADLGISEEHALTFSGALSISGFHPIVNIYSTFLQRAYDEISHDCARMGANLTLLIERSGLVGANGETHQGIYDEGFLKSIPNVMLSMPSDMEEAKMLYEYSLGEHGIFGIRIPREMVLKAEKFDRSLTFSSYRILHEEENKKVLVLAVGPKARELEALRSIFDAKVSIVCPLILHPTVKSLVEYAKTYESIVIYDSYSTSCGFAEEFMAALMSMGYRGSVTAKALPVAFLQALKPAKTLKEYGLTPKAILDLAISKS